MKLLIGSTEPIAVFFGGRMLRPSRVMEIHVNRNHVADGYVAEWADADPGWLISGAWKTEAAAIAGLYLDTAMCWREYVLDCDDELTDDAKEMKTWLLQHFKEMEARGEDEHPS